MAFLERDETIHYTIYTIQYTIYTIQYTIYTIQYSNYIYSGSVINFQNTFFTVNLKRATEN